MSATATQAPIVALIGNPNTGKSTLFNALAGSRQRTGNFPGCTVEKKIGRMLHEGAPLELIDLPGTYSLSPRSPDEMLAVDVLLGRRDEIRKPDAVICIVDASNLERNLYLVSQVLELGLPTVLVLNMTDLAKQQGIAIHARKLSEQIGVPIVEMQAHKRVGLTDLKALLSKLVDGPAKVPPSPFPKEFQEEVKDLEEALARQSGDASANGEVPRYLVERLLLDTSGYLEGTVLHVPDLHEKIASARERLTEAGYPVPGVEAMARYTWVGEVLAGALERPKERPVSLSDRLDRVLTHKIWGVAVFALLMIVVFQSVFSWAVPLMDLIDGGFGALGEWVAATLPPGPLADLLVDGVIAGVGGVLIFLPQIMILFFFIAVMEDCGYMARAAYLMDKLMARVGLSGKSFIPLLSSFACAIPGVMATRVIENPRDRLTTILVAPLMSCSARLPVYIVLTAAFIPSTAYFYGLITLQGLTMVGMYLVGIVAAVVVAFVLKKTLLRGETPPFVMELPSYKWPSPKIVIVRMFDRGWAFVRRAGTIILAASIVVWALGYFPGDHIPVHDLEHEISALEEQSELSEAQSQHLAELKQEKDVLKSRLIEQSYLGQLGHAIEPVVRPLGWDWKIGAATVASFPAREVIIATLGVIYSVGDEIEGEEGETRLQAALLNAEWEGGGQTGQPVYNIPVALSIMVFFALCAQCVSTLAIIKRETNSWWWPVFTFVYMTVLAYLGALVTYQGGMWLLG